ncbi:MAG TPA: thiamine-phosphate synthase family protein, partial [Nitrososphaerales archaeon]|nr:thiamine-phosphate synthase family protein [Nitrososphaerales archaeon]
MQPPDELMVQVFLPAMRQLVARELRSQGLSQSRISSMLGVTQASVSLYLSSKPERAYSDLESLSVQREEADRNATLLAEDVKRSPVYGVETLGSLWRGMLGRGRVCEAHRRVYPSLSQCDVCVKEYGERERDAAGAIDQVAAAVRMLESSQSLVSVMPEVSVNLAYAPPGAASAEDV